MTAGGSRRHILETGHSRVVLAQVQLGLIDNYIPQVTAAASCRAARKWRLLRS